MYSQKSMWFYQIQLSDNLQLIKKTYDRTGNQKKGNISLSDQQVYYLQVFERLY